VATSLPRDPFQRVIFHRLILLFGFSLRQGMIIGIKYQDIQMAVIRDPEDGNKRRLVANFTILRNELRVNTLEHKKGEKSQFSPTLLPSPLFCLTHIVAVRGIYTGAFKASYRSVDELLY
jgi:hypothetical protein